MYNLQITNCSHFHRSMYLWNKNYSPDIEYFCHPQSSLVIIYSSLILLSSALGKDWSAFCHYRLHLSLQESYVRIYEFIQYVFFPVWNFPLRIMILRLIHVGESICGPLLLFLSTFPLFGYIIFCFSHSPVGRHLGSFQCWDIVNKAFINICLHFLYLLDEYLGVDLLEHFIKKWPLFSVGSVASYSSTTLSVLGIASFSNFICCTAYIVTFCSFNLCFPG